MTCLVNGADIHVGSERDDRDFHVVGLSWRPACRVFSRLCAAVFSAVILPLDAIEPVLSSASARLSFLMPQMISAVAETVSSEVPIRVREVRRDGARAGQLEREIALLRRVEHMLIETFCASGRLN